ncbi:MAG TPA: PBP1A family penicillin-binding protein [Stellaceae bacterium]|nr:PBP1A family penicillin-binding protein [Stellaceae bacterium]
MHGAAKLAVLLLLWAAILGTGFVVYCIATLPDTSRLDGGGRRASLAILARDGTVLATYGDLHGRPLSLRQMSPYLPQAVIATEDRRFYSNFGIDPLGMVRAALADLAAGHIVEGGSTITQQLAKNLFLSPARSLTRKVQEILLALWLDHRFTKDQILEIYLNRVYFGAGTYGVDAAAHRYFGKSARRLSLYESAEIAGLLQAPSRLNPLYDPHEAAARTSRVLANMVDAGFISAGAAAAAKRSAVVRAAPRSRPGVRYFTDWVAEQAKGYVGERDRDLVILTTLDPRLESAAATAVADMIDRYGRNARVSEGALVALAPDGAVRAMIGGFDYDDSPFNRAVSAARQPGSAFKPFVYLAGLEAGLSPADRFVDMPIRVGDWQPRDYGRHYRGAMTMAEALAQSINTVAVQVALRAGLGNVVAVAHRLGIASPLTPEPSLALGADAVDLLELVSAYAPFANGGFGVWPYGIVEIRDRSGRVLFRRNGSGLERVVSPEHVAMMNRMLSGVMQYGTGRRAALPRPVAGKTGTTQDYRDAWFIGYTADLVAGVWLGNDDDTPMNRVTGGSLPAALWHRFMTVATRDMPVRPLPGVPETAAVAAAEPGSPRGVGAGGGGLIDEILNLFRRSAPPPPYPPGGVSSRDRGGY